MNLLFAPFQGITIARYRSEHAAIFGGVESYYAPFIVATEREKSSKVLFRDVFAEDNDTNRIVPQLLSNNGRDFNYFASQIVDMGYKEINWNIGCPYPMVTKKKRGSGILPYPDMIRSFLDEVCRVKHFDLTVKMRLGLKSTKEGIKVIEALNDYPLSGVMIHPRTGNQLYKGTVDLESFEQLAPLCKHPLTYNGDIFTYDDFKKIQMRFPNINSFMLGRGLLRDPFLAARIKGQVFTTSEKISKLRTFHDAIYTYYQEKINGDKKLCNKMKEFWVYTSAHLDPDGSLLQELKYSQSSITYLHVVDKLLNPNNNWND